MPNTIDSDTTVQGDLTVTGLITAANAGLTDTSMASSMALQRAKLEQNTFQLYPLKFEEARIWNTATSFLGTSASGDDLGLIQGTFGTDPIEIQSSDAAGATVTQYCRWPTWMLPPEYDDGQTIQFWMKGKMQTVSDTTAVADWDCWYSDGDGTLTELAVVAGDTDKDINSGTAATYKFDTTSTSLTKGNTLDIRLKIDITDAVTGANVIWEMYEAYVAIDIRG